MYCQVITQISSETTFDAGVILYNANSLQRWRWMIGWFWCTTS